MRSFLLHQLLLYSRTCSIIHFRTFFMMINESHLLRKILFIFWKAPSARRVLPLISFPPPFNNVIAEIYTNSNMATANDDSVSKCISINRRLTLHKRYKYKPHLWCTLRWVIDLEKQWHLVYRSLVGRVSRTITCHCFLITCHRPFRHFETVGSSPNVVITWKFYIVYTSVSSNQYHCFYFPCYFFH